MLAKTLSLTGLGFCICKTRDVERIREKISSLPQCLAHIGPSMPGHFLPGSATGRVLALLPARDHGTLDLTTHAQGSRLLTVLLKPVPDLVSLFILPDKPPESLLGCFFFFFSFFLLFLWGPFNFFLCIINTKQVFKRLPQRQSGKQSDSYIKTR